MRSILIVGVAVLSFGVATVSFAAGGADSPSTQSTKPVDPDFRSAMPVIEPPKHTKLPMKVIEAPPCRQSAR